MSRVTRLPHLLNTVLLGALWGFAWSTFSGLPDRIPVHFGATGAPDRWAHASAWNWFSLPLMSMLITGILYACSLVPLLGVHRPGIVSMPARYREGFMALPPERRRPIMDTVRAMLYWLAVPPNALFAWTLIESHAVATGQRQTGRFLLPTALVLVSAAVIMAVGLRRVFGALEQAAGRSQRA